MEYQRVSSSNVEAVAYDAARKVLGVRFRNGSEYHYQGVPESIYSNLLKASSVGSFLNREVVRGGFQFTRVS